MPQIYAGEWALSESFIRSLCKTISWRLTGSGATFVIAWIMSGNAAVAGGIAVTQAVANTLLYFIHERIWNKIGWERR